MLSWKRIKSKQRFLIPITWIYIWVCICSYSPLCLCQKVLFVLDRKTQRFFTSMYALNYTNKHQHISCEVRLHCKRLLQFTDNTSCLHSVKTDYHLPCYLPYTIQGTLAILPRITVPICSLIWDCIQPTIKYSQRITVNMRFALEGWCSNRVLSPHFMKSPSLFSKHCTS